MKWFPQSRICQILILIGFIYFFSAKGLVEISDTDYSIRTAKAIIEDQTLLIDPPDPAVVATSPQVVDGKIYSKYGVGLVIIFLPIVTVAKLVAFVTTLPEVYITGFLISFYNVPFAIGALIFLNKICILLGATQAGANLVVIFSAVGTFFWKYTVSDYSEVTQVFFLLGAIYFLFRGKDRDLYFASIMFSGLILMKLVNVLLWIPLALYLILNKGLNKSALKPLLKFASIVFITGLLLLSYNHIRFGNPFLTGYESEGQSFSIAHLKRDFLDYLFSSQRGLFTFNPILIAAIPFWPILFRTRKYEATCLLLIILMWVLLMSSWVSYQGGWAWGNRLLIFTIPLLLIPLSLGSLKKHWQIASVSVLFVISVYIQIVSVFQHTHEYFVILRDMENDTEVVEYLGAMPSQLPANVILFHQKLMGSSGEYLYSIFLGDRLTGPLASKLINTLEYQSYQSLHAWPFHLASFMGLPNLRWLLLGTLPFFAFLAYIYFTLIWRTNINR